jgi:branched-chain amino acid transport system substrate-binding protein
MTGGPRQPFAILVVTCLILGFVATGEAGTGPLTSSDGNNSNNPSASRETQTSVADEKASVVTTPGSGPIGGVAGGGTKSAAGLTCAAGSNGNATDKGVTASKIRLATTAVLDGPGASLLSDAPTAMKAVIDKVNRAGGICGRRLELTVVNDSFKPEQGQGYIRNFIEDSTGYFALPVVPSAEGLSASIRAKLISKAGIPVVGTDGLRIEQFDDPWVWPVGSATVSTMRAMAKYAYDKLGARTFAIVYDSVYKFGIEGADAFAEQVNALGGQLVERRPLDPSRPSYSSDAQAFNEKCKNNKCDMVAMLLLPDAAKTWMAARPVPASKYTAGAQTLFTERFARDCVQAAGNLCSNLAVWTGYNPPIGAIASMPGVAQYVKDVRAMDPGIDVQNQFLEGAYLGMSVFVEAVRRVGPELTRDRLKEVLDHMTYPSDLAPPLTWSSGHHHANFRARAFAMVVAQGTFTGWRDEQTGAVPDPVYEK